MPAQLPSTLRGVVGLCPEDLDWLHQLIADWQVIADLSVSDLVLWARTQTGRFVAVAHSRPSTGTTVHLEDVIGRRMPASREALAFEAFSTAQIIVAPDPQWTGRTAVREEFVPVLRDGHAVAVMTRETAVGLMRKLPSRTATTSKALQPMERSRETKSPVKKPSKKPNLLVLGGF